MRLKALDLLTSSLSSMSESSARHLLLPFASHNSSTIRLRGGDGDESVKVIRKFDAVTVTGVERPFQSRLKGGRLKHSHFS